jgi:hypothetical protein
MTEYRAFKEWAEGTARRLEEEGGAARVNPFLRELQRLNGELLVVCDDLSALTKAKPLDLLQNLRRYARLLPDPLRRVRARMREIRGRYPDAR